MMAKPGSQLVANSTKVLGTLTWEYANEHVISTCGIGRAVIAAEKSPHLTFSVGLLHPVSHI